MERVRPISEMADILIPPEEHAETLMTKWWSAEEMMRHGVPCREGPFTEIEREQAESAIARYKGGLSDEDIEDIIFGATKKDRFWASVTCAVPTRRVRSMYDHVQGAYHPLRMKGKWSTLEDSALVKFVKGYKSDWNKIGEAMQRTTESCRGGYQQYLVHAGTGHKGHWSDKEGARLARIIETLTAEGKTITTSQKFWKEVLARMVHARSPKQYWGTIHSNRGCKTKGGDPIGVFLMPMSLFTTSLSLDLEADIPWNALPDDGWRSWSGHRLQQKWAIFKKTVWTRSATHRGKHQHFPTYTLLAFA
ncbi:hypothetical protein BJY52DRAFT_1182556 [Lactarius psammicola]|nr:hypothetical protein BJY52DRAFT_1182556 [Lactarius psammicola]